MANRDCLYVRFRPDGSIIGNLPPGAEVSAAGLERAAVAIRQIDDAIPWGNPHVERVDVQLDVRAPSKAQRARETQDTSCRPEAQEHGRKL